jgi:hypothetical protein
VVADWADDGKVDGRYPPRCYGAALRALPEDVRAYSTAVEDIRSAMYARIGEARENGDEGNTPLGTSPGRDSGGTRRLSSRGEAPTAQQPAEASDGVVSAVGSGASRITGSIPLPLVLVAALMLLLGLAGSTSLIGRGQR